MNSIIEKAKITIIAAFLMALLVSTTVLAGNDKCGMNGCNRENTPNGTVFCDKHAAEYAREKGYKVCAATGCYDRATSGNQYCSRHKCKNQNCSAKAEEAYGYCKSHGSKKSTSSSSYSYKGNSSKKTYKNNKSSKSRI